MIYLMVPVSDFQTVLTYQIKKDFMEDLAINLWASTEMGNRMVDIATSNLLCKIRF